MNRRKSGVDGWSGAAPPAALGGRSVALLGEGGLGLGALLGAARGTALVPAGDRGLDIAGHGDQGWAFGEAVAGGDDAVVEVGDVLADVGLGGEGVELGVELGVLLAEGEAGREEGDVLALDELLDPPVRVVGGV